MTLATMAFKSSVPQSPTRLEDLRSTSDVDDLYSVEAAVYGLPADDGEYMVSHAQMLFFPLCGGKT